MSNAQFLSRLGCLVIEKFFTDEQCKQLRLEVSTSDFFPAQIINPDDAALLEEDYRRTMSVEISKASKVDLYDQILALKPRLEQHFDLELASCEVPQLLLYREGDFFRVHKDAVSEQAESRTSRRQISIVIFLNSQSKEPGESGYCGGSLNLYGLINKPGWTDKAFPLGGEAGLFVAFRSETLHEVTPVTHGERYSIVNWFY